MGTMIQSNGSKWMGEAPDPIESLFDRLSSHPLSPTFEDYGNFILTDEDPAIPRGYVRFWGNFWALSAVFCIQTDDPVLITRLTMAIRANQARPDYQEAKVADVAAREERRKADEARERARRERVEVEDRIRREIANLRQEEH